MKDPWLSRVKPGKRNPEPFNPKEVPIAELDARSDDLYHLRQHVAEFGDICMGWWPVDPLAERGPPVRVRDIFRVNKAKRVVRDGPRVPSGKLSYS